MKRTSPPSSCSSYVVEAGSVATIGVGDGGGPTADDRVSQKVGARVQVTEGTTPERKTIKHHVTRHGGLLLSMPGNSTAVDGIAANNG